MELAMPILGGMLIGLSVSLLFLFEGRILGVSGIVAGTLMPRSGDFLWRVGVIFGFLSAGVLLAIFWPQSLMIEAQSSPILRYTLAGLLVGFGTQLGSGCTSGHGICGISRLSPRSLVATLTFMSMGILVVALLRALGVIS